MRAGITVIVVAVVAVVVFASGFNFGRADYYGLRVESVKLMRENEKLGNENDRLEGRILDLESANKSTAKFAELEKGRAEELRKENELLRATLQ